MKKYLIVIMLFMSAYSYAVPVRLTLSGEIELGSDIASYNAFANVNAAFNLYFWKCKNKLYGGSLTWMQMDWQQPTAYPFREIYYFGNRFSLYGFFVDVKHFCNHPVKSDALHTMYYTDYNGMTYTLNNKRWWSNYWGEAMTTVSVGYEFEFDIYHN